MVVVNPYLAGLLADAGAAVDFTVFAQYGVLGIIATILIWFARGAHKREQDRADRLEQENQRLHELILDRVIPALTAASQAAEESAELLRDVQRERSITVLARRRLDNGDL